MAHDIHAKVRIDCLNFVSENYTHGSWFEYGTNPNDNNSKRISHQFLVRKLQQRATHTNTQPNAKNNNASKCWSIYCSFSCEIKSDKYWWERQNFTGNSPCNWHNEYFTSSSCVLLLFCVQNSNWNFIWMYILGMPLALVARTLY